MRAALPSLTAQAERLIELGVPGRVGLPASLLRDVTAADVPQALLAVHPAGRRRPPSPRC